MSSGWPRRAPRRPGDTSARAADMRPGSPRPPPPDRPGGPCTDPSRGRLADVDRPSGRFSDPPSEGPTEPAAEPRQRWRIAFARDAVAAERVGRVALEDWQQALVASGLPVLLAGGRPRFAVAAPLPTAARAERELVEIWLVDRRTAWQVREALTRQLPEGHHWVDAQDVWLGAPAIVGQVSAADWRIELARSAGGDRERLSAAVETLSAARTISRVRRKGT